ncbi:hypothetical protein MAHJHV54_49030 [Mycobacterium avium subsp. hominissuis]
MAEYEQAKERGEPNSGDTTNSTTANASCVLAEAEWIRSEFSASTAAASGWTW